MKKFIIKINGWNFGYFEGTMGELEKALSSVGSEIVGTKEIEENDFGIVFNKEIATRTKCVGYDQSLNEKLEKEIRSILEKNGVNIKSYEEYDFSNTLRRICLYVTFFTDKVTIIASDGEFKQEPNVCYISGRDYCSFKDFDKKLFWEYMESFAFVSEP